VRLHITETVLSTTLLIGDSALSIGHVIAAMSVKETYISQLQDITEM
jgi:hypothetical protein